LVDINPKLNLNNLWQMALEVENSAGKKKEQHCLTIG